MRAIVQIALNDLRIFFGQLGNWVGLALLPVAFTALLGWAFTDSGGPVLVRVDVVNLDDSQLSSAFVETLRRANDTLVLCPMDNDEANFCRLADGQTALTVEEALTRVQEKETRALVVVPAGFSAQAAQFEPVQLDYYSLEDAAQPSPILASVDAALEEINTTFVAQRVGMALVDELTGAVGGTGSPLFTDATDRDRFADELARNVETRYNSQPEMATYVTTLSADDSDPRNDGFTQSIPGMGALFVMFTVLGGMSTLLRERQQWTLQRLAIAPLRRSHILGGKIMTYFVLGMIQFLIIFAVGFIFDVHLGNSPLGLLAIMGAFVLCITAMTFALAPHMKSQNQASGLARLLGLTLAPLGGAWWPLSITPPFMQTIGHLSPVAWAMDGFHIIIYNGGGLGDVLVEIGVLLAASALIFVIGLRSFRVES